VRDLPPLAVEQRQFPARLGQAAREVAPLRLARPGLRLGGTGRLVLITHADCPRLSVAVPAPMINGRGVNDD